MMARSSFWSRLTTLLLVVAATFTLTVSRQNGATVLAGALAQLPVGTTATTHVLSYQGRLADPTTGAPKADGSYSMTFRIYDAAAAGTTLWTEIKDVTVSKGFFSTLLGDTEALPATIFDGNDRWLGVKVLSDAETAPRMRLAFVPYATWAINATALGGQASAFYRNANNLNAGSVPDARLDAAITRDSEVKSIVTANDGAGSGVDADLLDGQDSAFYRNASNINAGTVPDAHIPAAITRDSEVIGIVTGADGSGSGLDADLLDGLDSSAFLATSGGVLSSGTANPVLKVTQSGTNPNHGVAGLFSSAESYGVQGETSSATVGIAGVLGSAGLSGVTIAGKSGLLGQSDTGFGVVGSSLNNSGIFGWSTNDYAIDGQGPSTATGGVRGTSFGGAADTSGVYGLHTAGTGVVYGVRGQTSSTTGRGVYGNATAATGAAFGVYGESNSSSGRGVYGVSPYLGVYGYASAAGAGNYAGYFAGDVHVSGNLSKSSGTFKIDHPLDPENKYLSHSFVESPDMMNVYNGNVALDENGAAWVDLPAYFQALNRDFRYQLTAIGGPGPNLYIAQEVQNNRFQIAGGGPGLRVSWQVTGIRQDAYANAHPVIVEQEKPENERGTYLYPEAFGKDRSKGLDFRLNTAPLDSPQARPKPLDDPALFAPQIVNE